MTLTLGDEFGEGTCGCVSHLRLGVTAQMKRMPDE